AHVEDRRWPLQEATEGRLYKLVTGSEQSEQQNRPEEEEERPVAPFARVLTRYFPELSPGRFEIKILAMGGHDSASDRIGTFNVAGAIKAVRREACPLCDDRNNIHTSSRRTESWLSIPAHKDVLEDQLAVFYFDLEQNRVPARYDSVLPMPSAQ